MIRKKILNLQPQIRTAKIDYTSFKSGMNTDTDENLLPHKQAALAYNFSAKEGALCKGIGIRDLRLLESQGDSTERIIRPQPTEGVLALWHSRFFSEASGKKAHSLLFYTKEKEICLAKFYSFSSFCPPLNLPAYTSVPIAINYRLNGKDVLILVSDSQPMTVVHPDTVGPMPQFPNAPKIKSCCLHYERLFAIDAGNPYRIWFSDNLDPTNWNISLNEGGYIELANERGSLQTCLYFHDYVFIFHEFGISRLSAYGEQSEFSVTGLFTSSGKIYPETIKICGDRIIFLASDGLYSFTGHTTTKIQLGIEKLFENINNSRAAAAYRCGKYYLACKMNFGDGQKTGCENDKNFVNNVLLELDLKTGDFQICRGIDIISMILLADGEIDKIAVCFNGKHADRIGEITDGGQVFEEEIFRFWKSPDSNLGYPDKVKIVKELSLVTEENIEIEIKCDGKLKKFKVSGSKLPKRIFPKLKGKQIEVSFISRTENCRISRPQVFFEII